jgi:hypothetical protein
MPKDSVFRIAGRFSSGQFRGKPISRQVTVTSHLSVFRTKKERAGELIPGTFFASIHAVHLSRDGDQRSPPPNVCL